MGGQDKEKLLVLKRSQEAKKQLLAGGKRTPRKVKEEQKSRK